MKSLKVVGMFVLLAIVGMFFVMDARAERTVVKQMGSIEIIKDVDPMTDEISYWMHITHVESGMFVTICQDAVGISTITGIFDRDYETDTVKHMFRFDDRPAYSVIFMVSDGLHHSICFNNEFKSRLIEDMKKSNFVLIKLNLYRGNNIAKISLTGFTTMYNEFLKLSGK